MIASACGARSSTRADPGENADDEAGARRPTHQQVGGRIPDDRRPGRRDAERLRRGGRPCRRAGFTATPSSAQTTASTRVRHAERGQRPLGRLAVVAGRDGDPPAARREGRRTGRGGPPAGRARPTGSGACQAPASGRSASSGESPLRSSRSRVPRGGAPSASRPAGRRGGSSGRRVDSRASRTAVRRQLRPVRRRSRVGEVHRPAAPHRVELDERAVLVEDDEVDAVERGRSHLVATASGSRGRSSRAAPSTKQASGGNETVHVGADVGQRQVRLVERVERDHASAARRRCPSPRLDPDPDDRAEEVDVLDRAVQPVRSPASPSPSAIPSGRTARVTSAAGRRVGDRLARPDLLAVDDSRPAAASMTRR